MNCMNFPESLSGDIKRRIEDNNLRALVDEKFEIDFFSNDYLGYARSKILKNNYKALVQKHNIDTFGATGSRLISGNHFLFDLLETKAKNVFNSESALFFNSGYDANIGLLSSVLKPRDVIFYDELCHASIRDGLQMGKANSYKFKHNDYKDLIHKIESQKKRLNPQNIYIISESVFSMDGDISDIHQLVSISKQYKAYLIIDEAHALGVCGKEYKGLSYDYEKDIFARIYTCGKSLGTHGGFVLGSKALKEYLINFSRPFIYTTGASPHQIAQVIVALEYFETHHEEKHDLQKNILCFKHETQKKNHLITANNTAIQVIKIPDNQKAKELALQLQKEGFGVKAILHPTVPKGQECIRICLHSFNTKNDIYSLILNV